MVSAVAVIGSGFGDEGKGLMTDYFSCQHRQSSVVVVRFNGGAQAGHTVVNPSGTRHVFSHFGSGTLAGAHTHLSSEFIVNPIMFNREHEALQNKHVDVHGKISIHPACRVTTPYEMLLNQIVEDSRSTGRHGSVGLGIQKTIKRHNQIPLSWMQAAAMTPAEVCELFEDIRHFTISRLNELHIAISGEQQELLDLGVAASFYNSIREMEMVEVVKGFPTTPFDRVVFEGAQGLLLSEKYGTMPHCTPTDTGVAGIFELCKQLQLPEVEVCYVSRAYTTRHGNGPLTGECSRMSLGIAEDDKTNVPHAYQGTFRYARLDVPRVRNAIIQDFSQVNQVPTTVFKLSLAVTCLDQLPMCHLYESEQLIDAVNPSTLYTSYGPTYADVKRKQITT